MSALLLEKHEVQAILCSHAKAISSNLQYNTMTLDEQGDVVLTWVSPPEKPAAQRTFWDKLFRRKVRVYPEMDRPAKVMYSTEAGKVFVASRNPVDVAEEVARGAEERITDIDRAVEAMARRETVTIGGKAIDVAARFEDIARGMQQFEANGQRRNG